MASARLAQFIYQNVRDGGSRQDWLAPKGAGRDEIDRKLDPYAINAPQVLMHLLVSLAEIVDSEKPRPTTAATMQA